MDQHGCAENDPNGPVFDPVHGVFHHFYQIVRSSNTAALQPRRVSSPAGATSPLFDPSSPTPYCLSHLQHLAARPGHGPDYGHFVSKDFIHWAQLPVAIWNGLDASTSAVTVTNYDNEAIFTGSAVVVDGAGPGGMGKGVVNIYPGLCNNITWPACGTGTVLAQAVPADYANDVLLERWAKPSYNPIMENAQRDPSTPWKTSYGEWRLRTYDASIYGAASDADLLAGKWYLIGKSADLRECDCPSFYPLPAATPGTEEAYAAAAAQGVGGLPTHVHKTSCGGDWWQLGTYTEGPPKLLGHFNATAGWEDLFAQRKIETGWFFASKDNLYPALDGGAERRINWGWAQVPPDSAQTLPRVITFNAAARALQQAPIEELAALRGANLGTSGSFAGTQTYALKLPAGVAKQSEIVATFELPPVAASFTVSVGNGTSPIGSCTVDYTPPAAGSDAAYVEVPVSCSGRRTTRTPLKDTLRILSTETSVELRVFYDATFAEAFFQQGRVAMTFFPQNTAGEKIAIADGDDLSFSSTAPTYNATVDAYPISQIWTTPDAVRAAPREYQ
jgi:sucrose-6-phosphate hydrolase SacC (GH32 family)